MDDLEENEFYYIVIGGGISGVTCAEHLHILDSEAKILLLTASSLIKTVSNVLHLTKILDAFEVEERQSDELEQQCPNIKVFNDSVVKLETDNQTIFTSSGKMFIYRKLCICSGAIPKVFAESHPHVISIRDTESVQVFQKRLNNARRIVIIGNGGIATEMVYEVTGIEIIWAIKDKSMSATFIDPGAAEFLRPELAKEKKKETIFKRRKYTIDPLENQPGVMGGALGPDWHSGLELQGGTHRRITLETEVQISRILSPHETKDLLITSTTSDLDKCSWPVYVELTNGKIYGCDFIVSATGVVPNVSAFLPGNNFKLCEEGGFMVDDKLQTSVKEVYAAGDCCTPGWPISQHWFQMRLWTQARQMGSYAAKCMWASLNHEDIYMDFCFELFAHATKFCGHKVILLGLFNGQKLEGKYEILLRMTPGVEFVKCVMVDGHMQGAILIGETNLEETFENLILNQMDLTVYGEDLLNPDVDIEDYFD